MPAGVPVLPLSVLLAYLCTLCFSPLSSLLLGTLFWWWLLSLLVLLCAVLNRWMRLRLGGWRGGHGGLTWRCVALRGVAWLGGVQLSQTEESLRQERIFINKINLVSL